MATTNGTQRTTRKTLSPLNPKARKASTAKRAAVGKRRTEQLAEIGRLFIEGENEKLARHNERARRQADIDAQIAQDRLVGITLRGPRLDHAVKLLNEMNEAAYSAHDLARTAICTTGVDQVAAILVGIQSMMVVTCRRCDVLAVYLGETIGFGNFLDAVEPISPEAAARIEAEEREAVQ